MMHQTKKVCVENESNGHNNESLQVAIRLKHSKLITALRTAIENGEGSLDKEATSYDDIFDTFRISLEYNI